MINRIYNTFVFLIIIGLCFYSCNDDEKQKEKYKIMTLKVAAYRDYYVAPGAWYNYQYIGLCCYG